uniref:PDZ domain-containing protein n=1 Tax=Panagrolaimus sp. JU765 TaxID=591449 RepID=A0AC34R4V0_9BILA
MPFVDHPLQRFSRCPRMAFENINVRMTRTGTSITWGFSLRQSGPNLAVAFVEKDSMADKAGIQAGDTVEQVFGLKPGSLSDAQNRIQNSNEVSLVLKRFVAHPPELPWTLEENGNQVVVNRFDNQGRLSEVYNKNTAGYQNSFQTDKVYGPPTTQELHKTTNYKRTETQLHKTTNYKRTETRETSGAPIPLPPPPMPFSNTISSESHSNWDQNEGNVKKHFESNRTYTRTESSNIAPGQGTGFQQTFTSSSQGAAPFGGQQFDSRHTAYSNGTGTAPWSNQQNPWQSQHTSNVGGNAATQWNREGGASGHGTGSAGDYRSSSVQRPMSATQYHSPQPAQFQRNSKSVTPGRQTSTTPNHYDGPRMQYQRTPRTARELSPHATIQHLQYNSPLAMYSPESAAEAYKMQTGQDLPIDGDYPTGNRPAYLDSATRRAIAEEEQGIRYRSPTPQQSSSFKRISNAVGTPVQ